MIRRYRDLLCSRTLLRILYYFLLSDLGRIVGRYIAIYYAILTRWLRANVMTLKRAHKHLGPTPEFGIMMFLPLNARNLIRQKDSKLCSVDLDILLHNHSITQCLKSHPRDTRYPVVTLS